MTHLDRSLCLILATTQDVHIRQQQLISLLMDVLQQQPDPVLVNLIIITLDKHGILAYHFIPDDQDEESQTDILEEGHVENSNNTRIQYFPKQINDRCLVRLGPIVLELWNDEGYSDLLRGARDLCQLKNINPKFDSPSTTNSAYKILPDSRMANYFDDVRQGVTSASLSGE
eukprot:CAMPEP_0172462664 /NCGR_PEP_ID=MMETSP1065-20121228/44508_1 /TAXON_ID=265537 /ORGANISM="Amphiprora paludosa, Strain CCMP125" /LENGTH=171 /DNA_ID=CAMNT_0013218385 /DNA_START=522 /DNA_END=1038 /DNA_ORIENTATION=-